MEYYLAFKRKGILMHSTIYMNLTDQANYKKTNPGLLYLHKISGVVKLTEMQHRMLVSSAGRRNNGEILCDGPMFSVLRNGKFSK